MSATPPPIYDPRSTPPTTLKPYLELPHLLSLTWLAYPILSLLFVAFRLQLSSASASDAVSSAKDDLLASCKAAEQAATAAASMPRYMAVATNARITDAVNDTMNGAREALVLALTVMEAIINFIVDTYRSTFLCFLELVVRGGLSLLIGAVQELSTFVTSTFSTIRTSIQSDVTAANKAIQSAVDGINKINPFGNITVPQFSIPSLSLLENVTLPTDFENALVSLNNSLPTLSDLKDKVDSLIDTPFELVKKDINDTFAGLSFDVNALPIPAQNTVQFCDQMDTSVVDDLGRDLVRIATIGTIILIIAACLLIAAHGVLEWYKWRCQRIHMRRIREAWMTDPSLYRAESKPGGAPVVELSDHNLLMLHGNMLHPLLMKIANRISALCRLSPSQHVKLSWFFHYIFHPPAFACFLIGFVGLLSVELQLLAVRPLADKYSEQAVASANDFTNTIATSINASMYNQSAAYANDINGRVDTVQSSINDGLFGWVNSTTTTLNDTINGFYDDLQDAVQTVFNGTILESPVEEFIRCFLGSKVNAIEEALTFLHNNLVVNIPRVNESVLVLSPQDVDEATRPIATAAIGGGSGNSQGVVGKLVNTYISSLHTERIMFAVFIGLWLLVVLMAISVILWHAYGKPAIEAHRRRQWRKKHRAGIESIIVPFRQRTPSRRAADIEKPHVHVSLVPPPERRDPHSFTSPPGYTQSCLREVVGVNPRRQLPFGPRRQDSADVQPTMAPIAGTPTWKKPFTAEFWGLRKDTPKVDLATVSSDSGSDHVRPQLMVTTSAGSTRPIGDLRDSPEEYERDPTSAWSASPHKSNWLSNIVPAKMPSLRSKHRRTNTEPLDARSASIDNIPVLVPNQTPFAVPLHHGYGAEERAAFRPPPPPPSLHLPGYPTYGTVTEYSTRHLMPPSPANPKFFPPPPKRTVTDPSTRPPPSPPGLPQIGHNRHALQAVNPFATPFDDEYQEGRRSSVRRSSPTNPFIGVAF
ncbi:hypothetical protein NM688_g2805 [Phlebia brevispora]|uniref:Uncharacterized protein n=1 Tax=Phlebia brevispora TaxID=194682 RepID=A0ACC1T7G0_9APHY|nr:hypothetical protein NM688_g2805 [Phlebia brevispora]